MNNLIHGRGFKEGPISFIKRSLLKELFIYLHDRSFFYMIFNYVPFSTTNNWPCEQIFCLLLQIREDIKQTGLARAVKAQSVL